MPLWSQSDWAITTSICSTDVLTQEAKVGLWQTQSERFSVSAWLWEPTWAKERDLWKFEDLAMRTGFSEGGTGPDLLPVWREVSKLRCLSVSPICYWQHKNNFWTCLRPSLLLIVCWNTYWWVKSLPMKYLMSCTNLRVPFSCLSVYDEWNSLLKDVAEGNEMWREDREAPHWKERGFFWLVHPW